MDELYFLKKYITKLTDYYLQLASQIPFKEETIDLREELKTIYDRNRNRLWQNQKTDFIKITDVYISAYYELLDFWNRISYKPPTLEYKEDEDTVHDFHQERNKIDNMVEQMRSPKNDLMKIFNNINMNSWDDDMEGNHNEDYR